MNFIATILPKTNKEGLHSVVFKVSFKKNVRRYVNTGLKVKKSDWLKASRKVKNDEASNKVIKLLHDKLEAYRLQMLIEGKEIHPETFDLWLEGGGARNNFNRFYLQKLKSDKSLVHSSFRDQMQTLNLLNEFRPDIDFNKITKPLIIDWNNFLAGKGYSTNTIKKHHKNLKKYINRAIDESLMALTLEKHPYRSFRVPRKESDRAYLTEKEQYTLLNLQLDNSLAKVRDLFIFSCNTGMRFIDTQVPDGITWTDEGIEYIPQKTQKSTGTVRIPYDAMLLPDFVRSFATKPLLKISNAAVNRQLKLLMVAADVNKLLTFHVARHTALTNFAKRTGNVFRVMKYGGLRKTDTAMVYIHLAGV